VLYLLMATIALGCVNVFFHVRRIRHRTSLILAHGLCAVSAASWLVYAIGVHLPAAASTAARPTAIAAPVGAEGIAAGEPTAAAAFADDGPKAARSPEAARAGGGPPEPPSRPELAVDPAVRRALGASIFFDTDRADVRPDSQRALADLADALNAHPEISLVEVQGHADERGDDAYNVQLTRERAALVVSALVAKGVARERLHAAGYGARCPAQEACGRGSPSPACHVAAQWEKDRRVVFQVLEMGGAQLRGDLACRHGFDLIPDEDRPFQAR